jgi:hypothetical protein
MSTTAAGIETTYRGAIAMGFAIARPHGGSSRGR